MRNRSRSVYLAALAGLCLVLSVGGPGAADAQGAAAGPAAADDVLKLRVKREPGGSLIGLVQNSGSTTVRDVRLLIRHTWLWKNERHPGPPADNPGRSAYYMVEGDIPPGGDLRFRYSPSPALPVRTDGSFATTAEIVGFVEAGPSGEGNGNGETQ